MYVCKGGKISKLVKPFIVEAENVVKQCVMGYIHICTYTELDTI